MSSIAASSASQLHVHSGSGVTKTAAGGIRFDVSTIPPTSTLKETAVSPAIGTRAQTSVITNDSTPDPNSPQSQSGSRTSGRRTTALRTSWLPRTRVSGNGGSAVSTPIDTSPTAQRSSSVQSSTPSGGSGSRSRGITMSVAGSPPKSNYSRGPTPEWQREMRQWRSQADATEPEPTHGAAVNTSSIDPGTPGKLVIRTSCTDSTVTTTHEIPVNRTAVVSIKRWKRPRSRNTSACAGTSPEAAVTDLDTLGPAAKEVSDRLFSDISFEFNLTPFVGCCFIGPCAGHHRATHLIVISA
jgi:hypothetical protein